MASSLESNIKAITNDCKKHPERRAKYIDLEYVERLLSILDDVNNSDSVKINALLCLSTLISDDMHAARKIQTKHHMKILENLLCPNFGLNYSASESESSTSGRSTPEERRSVHHAAVKLLHEQMEKNKEFREIMINETDIFTQLIELCDVFNPIGSHENCCCNAKESNSFDYGLKQRLNSILFNERIQAQHVNLT